MSALRQLSTTANLRRAWGWVRSNPSRSYKNYFRTPYANFAVAEEELLAGILARLKQDTYEPAHACKVYLPKASGGLRPYSLLTVEDQIVYQAFTNVIAERFHRRVGPFHLKEVFSHRYAGKDSPFFYRRWQDGYAAFNRAVRRAFRDGKCWTAQLDLTACYDSLDHHVLEHFLTGLGCDREFVRRLRAALRCWTATARQKDRIYQGHGIPQGPLASGLLSEVVLHHFDRSRTGRAWSQVRYLRYVDDIRLFARTESDLRRAVNSLDLLSKDVGLFPQAAKIKIHRVEDIEAELKTVSTPDDDADWDAVGGDQGRLHARLKDLTPRYRVTDPTRFKYLLGAALPRARTNARLWKVMDHHPDLYPAILRYFQRYRRLPGADARRLAAVLRSEETHGSMIAELFRTADGRLSAEVDAEVDEVMARWWPRFRELPADLATAVGRRGMARGTLTPDQVRRAVERGSEWYTRAMLIADLDTRVLPQPANTAVLMATLGHEVSDVAAAAAVKLGEQSTRVSGTHPMHATAGPVLAAFGVLDGRPRRVCGVSRAFERLLGKRPPGVDWPRFFKTQYREAERKAVRCSGYCLSDATAWVNATHVFCDLLLDALWKNDPGIGGVYVLGNIGAALNPNCPLSRAYPCVYRFADSITEKRRESDLSHPRRRHGRTDLGPTTFIKYAYFKEARKLAEQALAELATRWPA